MVSQQQHQTAAQVEIEIDRKAQRESEKMLRSQWDQLAIHNYFATPLAGTFLNLPTTSCLLQCPSCGIKEMTKVVLELPCNDWSRHILNRFFNCCFCCCSAKEGCCQPRDHRIPSHYCNNCGCYFGQHKRIGKLRELTGK